MIVKKKNLHPHHYLHPCTRTSGRKKKNKLRRNKAPNNVYKQMVYFIYLTLIYCSVDNKSTQGIIYFPFYPVSPVRLFYLTRCGWDSRKIDSSSSSSSSICEVSTCYDLFYLFHGYSFVDAIHLCGGQIIVIFLNWAEEKKIEWHFSIFARNTLFSQSWLKQMANSKQKKKKTANEWRKKNSTSHQRANTRQLAWPCLKWNLFIHYAPIHMIISMKRKKNSSIFMYAPPVLTATVKENSFICT